MATTQQEQWQQWAAEDNDEAQGHGGSTTLVEMHESGLACIVKACMDGETRYDLWRLTPSDCCEYDLADEYDHIEDARKDLPRYVTQTQDELDGIERERLQDEIRDILDECDNIDTLRQALALLSR